MNYSIIPQTITIFLYLLKVDRNSNQNRVIVTLPYTSCINCNTHILVVFTLQFVLRVALRRSSDYIKIYQNGEPLVFTTLTVLFHFFFWKFLHDYVFGHPVLSNLWFFEYVSMLRPVSQTLSCFRALNFGYPSVLLFYFVAVQIAKEYVKWCNSIENMLPMSSNSSAISNLPTFHCDIRWWLWTHFALPRVGSACRSLYLMEHKTHVANKNSNRPNGNRRIIQCGVLLSSSLNNWCVSFIQARTVKTRHSDHEWSYTRYFGKEHEWVLIIIDVFLCKYIDDSTVTFESPRNTFLERYSKAVVIPSGSPSICLPRLVNTRGTKLYIMNLIQLVIHKK